MELLSLVVICFGVFTTVLWLVIGWRAMSAHERLARAVERMAGIGGDESKAPQKVCGQCGMPMRASRCTFCGWEEPPSAA